MGNNGMAVVAHEDGVHATTSSGSSPVGGSTEQFEVATDDGSSVLQFSVGRDAVSGATTLIGQGKVGLEGGSSVDATVEVSIGPDGVKVDVSIDGENLSDAELEEITRRVLKETAADLYATGAINNDEYNNILAVGKSETVPPQITREPGQYAHLTMALSSLLFLGDSSSPSRKVKPAVPQVGAAQSTGEAEYPAAPASAGAAAGGSAAGAGSTGSAMPSSGGGSVPPASSGGGGSAPPATNSGGGSIPPASSGGGGSAPPASFGGGGSPAPVSSGGGAVADDNKVADQNLIAKGRSSNFRYASQGNVEGDYFSTTPEGHVRATVSTKDRIPGFWNANRAEIAFNERFSSKVKNGFSSWFQVLGGQGFSIFQLFNSGGDQFPEVMVFINDKGELIIGGRAMADRKVNLGKMPADGKVGVDFTHNGDGTFSIRVMSGSAENPVLLGSATGSLTLPSGTLHYRAGPYFNGYNHKQFEPGKDVTADVVIIDPHMIQY